MDVQQNKIAYITGSSRGIGLALAEKLLTLDYTVIGLSRTNPINLEHPNFTFIPLDLSDLEQVSQFSFPYYSEHVVLVNNAGMIGQIKPVGSLDSTSIGDVMKVNTIAPQLLMNKFIHQMSPKTNQGHILNISSGAGKRPIDAWATYCASKAALDLFSATIKSEWESRSISNWSIHSVSPGVVDTAMQGAIRNSNPNDFKLYERFESLKLNDELSQPKDIVKKLVKIIKNPNQFTEILVSVRDMD